MRKLSVVVSAAASTAILTSPALPELGTNVPTNDDTTLATQRAMETGCTATPSLCTPSAANQFDSGIFNVAVPGSNQTYLPAERVQRDNFGVVGPFMLSGGLRLQDLNNLVYPSTTDTDKMS